MNLHASIHRLGFILILLCLISYSLPSLNGQNTIMWQVSHPNSTHQSYLFGTFHQIGNSFIDSFPIVIKHLKNADVAFFESVEDINKLRATLNDRPARFTYQDELAKSDVKFLEEFSSEWHVPLSKLTPIEIYIKLSQQYITQICGTVHPTDEWDHLDRYLIHLAKKFEIPIRGLETDRMQIDEINSSTDSDDWQSARRGIKSIVKNIKKRDTNTLSCIQAQKYLEFNLSFELDSKCEDPSMIRRNEAWLPQISKSIESQSAFVAVGLLHMYGDCGLIRQLEHRGYVVTPIYLN